MASPRCWQCRAPLDLMAGRPVGRTESCPECDADIRACRGCASFKVVAGSAAGTCDEPTAEQPADRERANFCGAFRLAAFERDGSESSVRPGGEDARSRLEALFKK